MSSTPNERREMQRSLRHPYLSIVRRLSIVVLLPPLTLHLNVTVPDHWEGLSKI